ncbi:ABC-type branched-subunit amino acid transport system substrate-binding protein [Rhodoligotrophos appendicifer]|uniref:ABC transporter substrate-binding protein n=1 Tax=Rhodoligotrophos appendicifer TaxID=987056 RepID=UPI00118476F5|nr:ABC transporter substrate-binding protein [Rhodoligotrophos appendicifer]
MAYENAGKLPIMDRRRFILMTVAAVSTAKIPSAMAQTQGVTDKVIQLGGVFALSGPVRLITEPYEQAARAYFDKINKAGGVKGRQIEWLIEDDAYQPAKALAGAKKLVERDGVFLLFGSVGTPTTVAISTYAERADIPFFSLNPTPETLKTTFALTPNYFSQIYFVTKHVVDKLGKKRVAYFYQNDDLGEAGRKGFEKALRESGLEPVADVGYERGTNDFSTYVLRLKDSNADAVVSMSTAGATATAIKQAKSAGYGPLWVAGAGGSSVSMPKLLGDDVNGVVFANEVESAFSDVPAVQEFRKDLLDRFPGATVDWGALVGYVHAAMMVEILNAATELTREGVIAAANSGQPLEVGLMPPVTYTEEKHIGANGVRIFEWRDGKTVPISAWHTISYD